MNKTETRGDFSPEPSEDRRESSYSGASARASVTTVTTVCLPELLFSRTHSREDTTQAGGEQPRSSQVSWPTSAQVRPAFSQSAKRRMSTSQFRA